MEKIVVPFRARRGLQVWPDGARLAVAIYMALEEWDREGLVTHRHPPPLTPALLPGMEQADLAIMSMVQYGFNVGIYRLVEMWEHHGVKVSLLSNALAAERHPELFRELLHVGYHVVGHGYEQSRLFAELSPEEQADDINRCIRTFENILGKRPQGWGSPGTRQYETTLELLAERGFSYHAGLRDDELPYMLRIGERLLVELPYRIGESGELNDYHVFSAANCRVGDEAVYHLRALFDARYEDSALRPQMLIMGVHPYVSGRPDRVKVLSEFVGYMRSRPGVWLTTEDELAHWWREIHPTLPTQVSPLLPP
jgi:allantoinase